MICRCMKSCCHAGATHVRCVLNLAPCVLSFLYTGAGCKPPSCKTQHNPLAIASTFCASVLPKCQLFVSIVGCKNIPAGVPQTHCLAIVHVLCSLTFPQLLTELFFSAVCVRKAFLVIGQGSRSSIIMMPGSQCLLWWTLQKNTH